MEWVIKLIFNWRTHVIICNLSGGISLWLQTPTLSLHDVWRSLVPQKQNWGRSLEDCSRDKGRRNWHHLWFTLLGHILTAYCYLTTYNQPSHFWGERASRLDSRTSRHFWASAPGFNSSRSRYFYFVRILNKIWRHLVDIILLLYKKLKYTGNYFYLC